MNTFSIFRPRDRLDIPSHQARGFACLIEIERHFYCLISLTSSLLCTCLESSALCMVVRLAGSLSLQFSLFFGGEFRLTV